MNTAKSEAPRRPSSRKAAAEMTGCIDLEPKEEVWAGTTNLGVETKTSLYLVIGALIQEKKQPIVNQQEQIMTCPEVGWKRKKLMNLHKARTEISAKTHY